MSSARRRVARSRAIARRRSARARGDDMGPDGQGRTKLGERKGLRLAGWACSQRMLCTPLHSLNSERDVYLDMFSVLDVPRYVLYCPRALARQASYVNVRTHAQSMCIAQVSPHDSPR